MQEVLFLHAKLDTVSVSTVNVNKITEDISKIFKYTSSEAFKPTQHFILLLLFFFFYKTLGLDWPVKLHEKISQSKIYL